MTDSSPRDLAHRLTELENQPSGGNCDEGIFTYEHPKTGDLYTERGGGERIDPDAIDENTFLVVCSGAVVMDREQAEREGREILGPARDTPPETDAVRVVADGEWGGGFDK